MKTSNLLKLSITLFLTLLFSCETEKTPTHLEEEDFLTEVKSWFTTEIESSLKLDDKQLYHKSNSDNYSIELEWKNSSLTEMDSLYSVELPIYGLKNKSIYSPKSSNIDESDIDFTKSESYTSFIIQKDQINQELRAFFMTAIPNEDYSSQGKDIRDINYFSVDDSYSGLIVFTNIDGSFNNAWKFRDGEIIKAYLNQPETEIRSKSVEFVTLTFCNRIYTGTEGNLEYSYTHCWSSTHTVYSSPLHNLTENFDINGGGGFYNPIGSGGGSGGYIPNPAINTEPEFEESPINCIKVTLDDGSTLSILLEGFNLDGYDGDLTFTLGDLEGDVNGKFVADGYVINSNVFSADIIIDKGAVSENAWIELARTILHESFHAYIYTKLVTNNAHSGLVDEANFSEVWKEYEDLYENQAGHNYMANNYISYMEEALKEFFYHSDNTAQREQLLNYVDGMPAWDGVDNFIERLCWTGLKNTEAWDDYISDLENKAKYDATYRDIVSIIPSAKDCNDEE